jgi:hypothetical protein
MVMNESTGIWERVERTDESLWLATNPDMEMVSPEGYRFAVSNGEIAVVPMLTCINDIGTYGSLVEGHHYIPIKTVTINGMTTGYELIDENRTVMEYAHWRFRVV